MPESVFCHGCMATTTSEAQYSNAGDRVCPACESDFIEISEVPAQPAPSQSAQARRHFMAAPGGNNQGYHRHFTMPGGHNVHLHVVTSMGGLPGPLESLLNGAEPAELAALMQSMQGVNLRPFNLPPGVSPGDYGPNGGAAFDDLMMQLMEAHQPQASPTSRDALSALPRRKVRSAGSTPSAVFSNTPSDQPAACACDEPCSVCHDSMEEHSEVVELPCQHCYHEDCITSWLKDHNTCPVCRKELPVDQELQQQQQQERQQRFQQEVQRQPAGLQSLFSALNPFHLFAGGPFPAAGQHGGAAAGQAGPHQGNAAAADAAPPANSNQMPVGTMERFEVVQTSLRELETRLQHQISSGNPLDGDVQAMEDHLRRVQLQHTRLQGAHDSVMQALHPSHAQMGADSLADNPAADAGSESSGIPDLVGSDDEDDAPHVPASDHHLNLQDLVTAARFAPHAGAQSRVPDDIPGLDDMPGLVSDGSESDSVPDLESDHDYEEDADDHLDHDSEYESDLSAEDQDEDALPPLVDIQRGLFTASFTDLSNTQPMTLDQLDAVDRFSHVLEESEDVAASGNLAVEQAVIGNRLEVPASEQHASASNPTSAATSSALGSPARDSRARRVVQRINSQSTPQNPAGPLQSQPSGLALATAPVSNPTGVIVNQRPVSQASMESELPRTVSSRPEAGNRSAELRSHPITHTPSRKRSFTPSEASSSLGTPQESMNAQGRQTERSMGANGQRSGGLLGPVSWAARGAGRFVGSLLRRNSNNRQ